MSFTDETRRCRLQSMIHMAVGRSSVAVATRYGLDDLYLSPGDWKFSGPIQTCPRAHPAFCITGTGSLRLGCPFNPNVALGSSTVNANLLRLLYVFLACYGTALTFIWYTLTVWSVRRRETFVSVAFDSQQERLLPELKIFWHIVTIALSNNWEVSIMLLC